MDRLRGRSTGRSVLCRMALRVFEALIRKGAFGGVWARARGDLRKLLTTAFLIGLARSAGAQIRPTPIRPVQRSQELPAQSNANETPPLAGALQPPMGGTEFCSGMWIEKQLP